MSERWLPVVGYEGKYEVSDLGRVRSLDRLDSRGHRRRGMLMSQSPIDDAGHLAVNLCSDGISSTKKVYRLVLVAFIGTPPPGMEGCHRDGDPSDNRLANLYWGTHSDNMLDRVAHGTHSQANQTSCKWGHPFDSGNTYYYAGHRGCRACRREAVRKYNARRRERSAA